MKLNFKFNKANSVLDRKHNHNSIMTDSSETATASSTTVSAFAHPDPRLLPARLVFGAKLFKRGTTILFDHLHDGKQVQVVLLADGRISQRDNASQVSEISHLTIKITVRKMVFEIDKHFVLSTPNDLRTALNLPPDHLEGEVHILRELATRLDRIDVVAMVHFKYFLATGTVDTSRGPSVGHLGPSRHGYKLSIQIACLKLAVALNAPRFLALIVSEIEYEWLGDDLSEPQLFLIIQAAPCLNKFLIMWTFDTPARNLTNKDNFIRWALRNSGCYRILVFEHAMVHPRKLWMPGVIAFMTGMQKRAIGTPLTQHSSLDDARSDVKASGLIMAQIIDSDFEELFGNDNSRNGEAGLEQQPQPQNHDQEN